MTNYNDFNEESLLAIRQGLLDDIDSQSKQVWEIEAILNQRMAERGAEVQVIGDYTLERKPTIEWDREALRPLLELPEIPADALKGGFTPAHDEVVHKEDAWNLTKIKPLIKFSAEAKRIIESAQMAGEPKFRITKEV